MPEPAWMARRGARAERTRVDGRRARPCGGTAAGVHHLTQVLIGRGAARRLGLRVLASWRRDCRRGAEAGMAARTSDRVAEEQAALRRVATLVARATPP